MCVCMCVYVCVCVSRRVYNIHVSVCHVCLRVCGVSVCVDWCVSVRVWRCV